VLARRRPHQIATENRHDFEALRDLITKLYPATRRPPSTDPLLRLTGVRLLKGSLRGCWRVLC
jgi:hypothetical protein